MSVFHDGNPSIDDYIALFVGFSPKEREIVLDRLQLKQDQPPVGESDTRTGEEISLDELCGGWRDDGRTAEEIVNEIYESRTQGRNWDHLYERFSP